MEDLEVVWVFVLNLVNVLTTPINLWLRVVLIVRKHYGTLVGAVGS